jgi:hypothetical protein
MGLGTSNPQRFLVVILTKNTGGGMRSLLLFYPATLLRFTNTCRDAQYFPIRPHDRKNQNPSPMPYENEKLPN